MSGEARAVCLAAKRSDRIRCGQSGAFRHANEKNNEECRRASKVDGLPRVLFQDVLHRGKGGGQLGAETCTTVMKATAMRPYSIAVAPNSLAMNLRII